MIRSLLLLPLLTSALVAGKGRLPCTPPVEDAHGNQWIKDSGGDKFEQFDWNLIKELKADEKGNMVMSPLSLKVVLAMLYDGAMGLTAREIRDALGLALISRDNIGNLFFNILKTLKTSKGKFEIKTESHMFVDEHTTPKESYLCKMKNYYSSGIEKVNFRNTALAVKKINDWAIAATEGYIQQLVSEADTDPNTIMLLLNAVYFKGLWDIPFPENQTKVGPFHLNDMDTVNVMMMNTKEHFMYTDIEDLKAAMIKLPYMGDKFAMYIVLPQSKSGLDELIGALASKKPLSEYTKEMYPIKVNLSMPKFEFDFSTSLRPALEKLSIKTMFGSSANLSDITESRDLLVSNIIQKAGISVCETGTVAYAATVIELQHKFLGDDEDVNFHADRPFMFFIQEEELGTTVFVGKVTKPEEAQGRWLQAPQVPRAPQVPQATRVPQAQRVPYNGQRRRSEGNTYR